MPRIILANIRADYSESVRETSGFLKGTREGTDTCGRFLWHAEEGDILVIPEGFDPDLKSYVGDMVGFTPDSVEVVTVDKLLTDATLLNEAFVGRLRSMLDQPSEWSLFPFVVTRGVVELAERLGLGALPGGEFARQSGIDLLNMKSTFRRLAAGAGTPIAEGVVARSARELLNAVRSLSERTGKVIAKQDRSGGGHGNIGLTDSPSESLPGTRETRPLGDDLERLAEELWSDLTDTQNQLVVVEAYYPAEHRFYLEYHLGDDGVEFLNGGMARYAHPEGVVGGSPEWIGLDLPLKLGSWSYTEVLTRAREFLDNVSLIGYRGHVNIDGLVTPDGRLVFHEINARWGGSLIYHTIAERLLGRTYADSHVACSVLDIKSGPLGGLLTAIERAGVGYRADKREGVVVLASASDLGSGAECLVLAESEGRARALEVDLRRCTEDA